ncbi:MAG: hypothetical protein ABSE73_16785 [Planctomycetota bacterium]
MSANLYEVKRRVAGERVNDGREIFGLSPFLELARQRLGLDAHATQEWRSNDALVTHFWRAISKIWLRHFAQSFRTYMESSVEFATENTEAIEDAERKIEKRKGLEVVDPDNPAVVIIRQLLDKALAEALQAVRANEVPVEATCLVEVLRRCAQGLQTLCRNRSITRQNVSKVDCLQRWCVSHNILYSLKLHLQCQGEIGTSTYSSGALSAQEDRIDRRLASALHKGGNR